MRYEVHTTSAASTLTQLSGYSAEETAGAAQDCYIRKTDGSGDKLVRIALAANGTETKTFAEPLDPGGKLYVTVATGCEVTIWGF